METKLQYIPAVYTRNAIILASVLGMRDMDEELDLCRGVDTLCVAVPDLSARCDLIMSTSTESTKIETIIDMLGDLIKTIQPRRVVISFQGPLVLQQIQMARVACWQMGGEPPLDLPGTTSCQALHEQLNAWVLRHLSCVVVICGPDVPGDALYKIRQTLRMSPPLRDYDRGALLYGRNNPHVLTVLALAPDIEIDLFYLPPSGNALYLGQPTCLSLLPYWVLFDYTFLPPPPPEIAENLLQVDPSRKLDCMQEQFNAQPLVMGSYEEYLLFLRQKAPPEVPPAHAERYLALVRSLYYYYRDGRMNNTALYCFPYCPTKLDFTLEPPDELHPLHVVPTNVQLALIAGTAANAISRGVSLLAAKLPAPPAPLPLTALRLVLRQHPTIVNDGMVSDTIRILDLSQKVNAPARAFSSPSLSHTIASMPVTGEL